MYICSQHELFSVCFLGSVDHGLTDPRGAVWSGSWGEVKRSNIIKFRLPCYQTLRVFSQIKDRKHIEKNFHSVAGIMPQGWDWGAGVKNFSVGICDGAPSAARSRLFIVNALFCFCLFLLLYVPCQQLWSLRDGQFT